MKDPTLTLEEYVVDLDSMVWLAKKLKKNLLTLANANIEGRSWGQPQFRCVSFDKGTVWFMCENLHPLNVELRKYEVGLMPDPELESFKHAFK